MENIDIYKEAPEDCKIFFEIIDYIDIGILIIDLSIYSVVFKNKKADYLLEQINVKSDFDSILKEFLKEHLRELQYSEKTRSEEYVNQYKNIFVGCSAYHFSSNNSLIAVLLQDVTEQRRMDSIAEAVEHPTRWSSCSAA